MRINPIKDTLMIQQTPQADRFKQQLRESLQHETLNSRAVKITRHANVYTGGDQVEMVHVSLFMHRFRNLGLIETNLDRFLVINEKTHRLSSSDHHGGWAPSRVSR